MPFNLQCAIEIFFSKVSHFASNFEAQSPCHFQFFIFCVKEVFDGDRLMN